MAHLPQKMALLVGCNYVGTIVNKLTGCINDTLTFKEVLTNRFGFQEADITVYTDKIDATPESRPTGINIKNKLRQMIRSANRGDLILLFYSGHGTQFIDDDNEVDEAIVPTDLNLITDVDFGDMLTDLRGGATFFFIADCYNSGGLLDKGGKARALSKAFPNPLLGVTNKFLAYPTLQRILSGKVADKGNASVSEQMKKLFADDASLKFTASKDQLASMKDLFNYRGILFSACQANEVSSEITIDNKKCSAFSAALQNVLRLNPQPLKNREVEEKIIAEIQAGPLRDLQHPKLFCSEEDREKVFLFQAHEAPASKDVGLPPLSDMIDLSGGASKELDDINKTYALEQINDVVEAYYRVSSKDFKDNFEDLYEKVAATKGTTGAVMVKDWAELLYNSRNNDKEVVNDFSLELAETGDDLLDRTDAMMIYYASRTKLQFRCQSESCGNRVLNHLFFTCLSCFRMREDTYNVCATCLTEKTRCPHGHKIFIDTHSLLQDYHMKELKQELKQTEKAFEEGSIFNGPEAKGLSISFTIDICSIM